MMTKESLVAQVITLDKRQDRRVLFAQQAEEQGLRFEWRHGHVKSTPAEGISSAHRKCVAYAQAMGWPHALIMEDDAFFTAPGAYDLFLQNVPASYDLYLGGIYGGNPDERGNLNWWSGMHCYLVHARFYETFLSVDPMDHLDHALWSKGEYYVCKPYTCMQRNGFSDNAGKVMNYAEWGKDKTYQGPPPRRNDATEPPRS